MVAAALGAVDMRSAPPAAAADVGMSKPVYGANEAVIVAVGMTDYVRSCAQQPGAGIPVNDWVYAVSDLYVVPSTWAPSGTITDVAGEPNVVFGQAFIEEVIGYTAPAGKIPPGRYGVVIDNCQDKHFDPAVDTFIPDAFRVTSQVLVPPVNIAAIKADAEQRAGSWMDAEYTFTGLTFAANAWEIYGAATDPADMLIFLVTDAFVRQAGLPDAKVEARNLLLSTARHWGGIAADPPNYAYDVPAGPGTVPTLESHDANALLRTQVALSEQAGIEGSLSSALLESIEKYQGAARDRNGVWARQHARAAQRHAFALSAQLSTTAAAAGQASAALAADTSDIDTIMSTVGDLLIDARTNGVSAEVRRQAAALGISNDDLNSGLRTIDNLRLSGISKAGMIANLDGLVAQTGPASADLLGIVNDLDTIIAQLDADPLMATDFVAANAGGPYSGATGATVALNASASTGVGTLTYAWDLDGDGAFDDATGATPTFTVAAHTPTLLSVKVTGIDGIADIATAAFTNTATGTTPRITTRTPAAGVIDITGGDTLPLSITPTGGTTTTWWVNAVQKGTGPSFSLVTAPGDYGSRQITAIVTAPDGQMTSTTWQVKVKGVDTDNDGWPIPLDCADDNDQINPGIPDIANGIDDDCNPSTSDGTPAPTVTTTSGDTSIEGSEYKLTGSIVGGGGGAISAKIDWGDGTTWTGAPLAGGVPHTYADDGMYVIQFCGKRPTSPWGCTLQEITVTNVAPAVNFVDLTDWMVVDDPQPRYQGRSDWQVADSRDSVLQVRNSDPSVFLSPDSYVDVEATVQLGVETGSDDDFIGFVIGGSPDMYTSDDADYLIIDWKQRTQDGALRGTRVLQAHGLSNWTEKWKGVDLPATTGSVTELARGTNFGSTGWADNTVYDLKFRYTPERLQVWIDGALEFDLTGDFPTDARFGFYNFSQDHVRYRNFAQSGITVDEGSLVDFPGKYADPGVLDTHTGLFSWDDGSPDDRVTLSSTAGVGNATARHRYADDGTYDSKLCITDNAGEEGCKSRNVYVRNVAPVVDAGRNRVAGPDLILDDSTYLDVGINDTHTATIDWGDGSPVEDAVTSGDRGSGIVAGAHRYSTDGVFTVTVCVTDDDGGVGCDTLEATVAAINGALTSTGEDDATVPEGSLIARQVAFQDDNPSDTHTATIAWGDRTNGAMAVADGGAVGVSTATHRYPDNGTYLVLARVCDDRGTCTDARSTITVTNVAPTLETAGPPDGNVGDPWSLAGTWADAGTADTHTVTIHWGDSTQSTLVPTVTGPGTGTLDATHTYTTTGEHTIETCITDDDGATTCTSQLVTITADPIDPIDPVDPVTPVDPTPTTTTPGGTTTLAPSTGTTPPATRAATGELPRTGSTTGTQWPLGLALIALGAVLVAITERRRRTHATR
jgi:hypothetical protein